MHVAPIAVRPQRVFAVILDEGEELAASLDAFARHTGLDAASFTGIGAIERGTLGFFDPVARDYTPIGVERQSEVVSLLGDITRSADATVERTVHGHMVVADALGRTTGGHLLEAYVRPTLELIVSETPANLQRTYDPERGLALIDLQRSGTVGRTFTLRADAEA